MFFLTRIDLCGQLIFRFVITVTDDRISSLIRFSHGKQPARFRNGVSLRYLTWII